MWQEKRYFLYFCTRYYIYIALKFKLAVKTNLYDNPTNYHTLKKLKKKYVLKFLYKNTRTL